jgi:processive 1,2-diacylglycerol beta-glucosyltransferase
VSDGSCRRRKETGETARSTASKELSEWLLHFACLVSLRDYGFKSGQFWEQYIGVNGFAKEGSAIERILLLTMGFGTGHNAAAKALKCQFEKMPAVTAEVVDLLDLIPGTFHPLLQSGYHGMLNKFPTLYHYLYDWTHHNKMFRYVSSELIEKMGWSIRKKMAQLFEQVQPTRIVSTHPFALLLCPTQWEEVPAVGVITDYELHPIWLMRLPHALFVPKRLLNQCQLEQIQWTTGLEIHETGIPVNEAFYEEIPKEEARRQLNLKSDEPVVLIMGGGTGLGPLEQLVDEIRLLRSMQFVVLTGKNNQLYHRLQKKVNQPHIRIEPFRCDIPLRMAAADLLVTKPGGLTISEAIAKKLPMFLFEALPGQEKANQQYLLHHRVAMITRPQTIRLQLEKFFSPDYKRDRMVERFTGLMSPNAGERIVHETLRIQAKMMQTL